MIRRFNFGGPLRSTLGIVWALIVGFVLGEEPIIAAHRAPPSATVCLVPAGRSRCKEKQELQNLSHGIYHIIFANQNYLHLVQILL